MKSLTTKKSYPHRLRRFILAGAVIGLVVYVGFQLQSLFTGPTLVVTNPVSGGSSVRLITVVGSAQRAEEVRINGNIVFINQDKEFSFPLLLLPGYNVVTVQAVDRFGTVAEQQLTVIGPDRNP